MRPVNINTEVKVKLTPYGKEVLARHYEEIDLPADLRSVREDAEGFTRWSLWELMQTFGSVQYMGNPCICFERNEIYFEENKK